MSKSRRIADLEACRERLVVGSKSFYAASLLLPARLRPDVYALYAFCRVADDAVDGDGDPVAAVARLRDRLERAYAGTPLDTPVDRAFADMVERRQLPILLPLALIEGFEWDAQGRLYETLSDVRAYGVRVAGTVGAMMSILMDVRGHDALARACDLGVAMQLTNIARDVGDDARQGRLYLPREWFADEGLDPDAWMRDPQPLPAIARMTEKLLAEADRLYERGEQGIALLPADSRHAIWAARYIYAAIGSEIQRNGMDNITQRAFVSKRRKLALLTRAYVAHLLTSHGHSLDCLSEAQDLVIGCAQTSRIRRKMSFMARVSWVIDLMERIESARLEESKRTGQPLQH